MFRTSIEIKAKCTHQEVIHELLTKHEAEFLGIDHQIDTYFKVPNGRLKLREGNIENFLIHYFRENKEGPKKSEITIFKNSPQSSLKVILEKALGVLTIVDKTRRIYYIENVKFHLDTIEGLGSFVEIEALDKSGVLSEAQLEEQCRKYLRLFNIQDNHLISKSYSDMMLNIVENNSML
ncbi:MAG: class IV adenylate cyclase [Chitinophagales bacterium]|nr:class IV adenylate cyclase [Chitinophagales bacterium]